MKKLAVVMIVGLMAVACAAPTPAPSPSPTTFTPPTPTAETATHPVQTPVESASTTPTPNTPTVATTSPSSPTLLPLAGKVIVIDPGHNGRYQASFNEKLVPSGNGMTKACNTSGTATNAGWPEHAYNWSQAMALQTTLETLGATVVLTRQDDDSLGPCVNDRAAVANTNHAALLISIHADGNDTAGARGFHVIYSTNMDGGAALEAASKTLAGYVRDQLRSTKMPRSTYVGGGTALSPRSDMGTLNLLKNTPGIMIEMGNMRSAADAALLKSPDFQASAAWAIATGCAKALS